MKKILAFGLFCILLSSCKSNDKPKINHFNASESSLLQQGRTEINNNTISLIGPASSIEFKTNSKSVTIYLTSDSGSHNYVVVTVNDVYKKRFKIVGDTINKITVETPSLSENKIGIYKATEAASGTILFHGVDTENLIASEKHLQTIEFIGNSITCGAAADPSDIPCGSGEYFDQHNSYLSYGPRLARALNTNFIISAVSGIGIYRNWNDENIEEPIMPQVYENLYLDSNNSKKYDFLIKPDLVSICLGTNDMSDGNGIKPRLDFNKEKFITNYSEFIKTIYGHYPNTKIALLTSPMISGERGDVLLKCLQTIRDNFKDEHFIEIFELDAIEPNSCSSHPNIEDHRIMAEQLLPFYKKLLNKE